VKVFLAGFAVFLVSCGAPDILRVRQFHLQDTDVATGHPFIRAEMNKRLYGAVTARDRTLRKGNYYNVRWNELTGKEPIKLLFEYRQAQTGAKVNQQNFEVPGSREGDLEIVVSGLEYLKYGHVQAWRVTLFEGESKIFVKKSYLWD
jgi:hypothetical protein